MKKQSKKLKKILKSRKSRKNRRAKNRTKRKAKRKARKAKRKARRAARKARRKARRDRRRKRRERKRRDAERKRRGQKKLSPGDKKRKAAGVLFSHKKESEKWFEGPQKKAKAKALAKAKAKLDAKNARSPLDKAAEKTAIAAAKVDLAKSRLDKKAKAKVELQNHFDKIRDKDAFVWEVVDTVAPAPKAAFNFRVQSKDGTVSEPVTLGKGVSAKLPGAIPKGDKVAQLQASLKKTQGKK